ncbi:MAG: LysM peptidoglycan-binding domain-containing protein [Bacilli bacterium]|nr:LysM peptidoglycan-binding domain-containing protein [Bacilli bacterium]
MEKLYKIEANDNLTKIAKRFGTTVEKLVQDNNISDPNLIITGEELTINLDNIVEDEASTQDSSVENTDTNQEMQSQVEDSNLTSDASQNTNTNSVTSDASQNTNSSSVTSDAIANISINNSGTTTATAIGPDQIQGTYSGELHSKRSASDGIRNSNGTLTYGNKTYTVGATTEGNTLSQNDYYYFVGQVAGESANDCDDMMGVACTILNRLESDGGTVQSVLEKGYWPWGKTCNRFLNYDGNGNPTGFKTIEQIGPIEYEKLQRVIATTNDAMNGVRNIEHNVRYYSGDGVHNYFSDNL